jgi:CRP/FNR family transcriptional regulator
MSSFASQKTFVSPNRAEPTFAAIDWESSDNDLMSERGLLSTLQPRNVLFHAGEQKTEFYRLEAGVFLISTAAADGSLADCRLAYPGEFLGLGFLSQHGSSATALIASTVSCFPLSDLDALEAESSDLYLQRANAVQWEFDQVREACVARSVQGLPIHKVANLLVVISRLDEFEGRDPNVVSEEQDCRLIAKLLGMYIELFAHSLKGLQILGLITWDPKNGLCIPDRGRLEAFGNSVPANDPRKKAVDGVDNHDMRAARAEKRILAGL